MGVPPVGYGSAAGAAIALNCKCRWVYTILVASDHVLRNSIAAALTLAAAKSAPLDTLDLHDDSVLHDDRYLAVLQAA